MSFKSKIGDLLFFLCASLMNNYLLNSLADSGVPAEYTLVGRGLVCLLCTVITAKVFKERMIPKAISTQAIRFLFCGFGLWALIKSYQYITPSQIALVARIDIPILIIFGHFSSLKASLFQKIASVVLIGYILTSIFLVGHDYSSIFGFSLACVGTILLSFGYLFVRYTSKSENLTAITLTPSIACVLFGLVISLLGGHEYSYVSGDVFLTALSGVFMFFTFVSVRRLYQKWDFFSAQACYVFIPLISIPIDLMIGKKSFYQLNVVVFSIVALSAVVICFANRSERRIVSGENKDDCLKIAA